MSSSGRLWYVPTVEVRWFDEGGIPRAVLQWFQQREGEPDEQPPRVDRYLRAGEDALGIKLREGRVEVKQRYRQYGVRRFHRRVSGLVEHWRKWSFELAAGDSRLDGLATPSASWIGVRKERQLLRYRIAGDGDVVAVPVGESCEQGCDLELARVSIGGRDWWSLCFEAFGDEHTLQETLKLVTRRVFGVDEPPALDAEHSYGYTRWLRVKKSER